MPTQVENGKAFEYAIAKAYYEDLKSIGIDVRLQDDSCIQYGRKCFEIQDFNKQSELSSQSFI